MGLSRRDAVGLGALVVTAIQVVPFVRPEGGKTQRPSVFTTLPGELTPAAFTPAPVQATPTLTPLPPAEPGHPKAGWLVRYFRGEPGGIEDSQRFVPALDLAYDGAPFNDMRDDTWSLTAAGVFDLGPGRYTFRFEHDGALRVLANGVEVGNQQDASIARVLEVTMAHEGGQLALTLEGRDRGGRFLLRER